MGIKSMMMLSTFTIKVSPNPRQTFSAQRLKIFHMEVKHWRLYPVVDWIPNKGWGNPRCFLNAWERWPKWHGIWGPNPGTFDNLWPWVATKFTKNYSQQDSKHLTWLIMLACLSQKNSDFFSQMLRLTRYWAEKCISSHIHWSSYFFWNSISYGCFQHKQFLLN